jgi:hypothetical protein
MIGRTAHPRIESANPKQSCNKRISEGPRPPTDADRRRIKGPDRPMTDSLILRSLGGFFRGRVAGFGLGLARSTGTAVSAALATFDRFSSGCHF